MSLIDEVKNICDRLAPLGWRDLLLVITGGDLDISQPNVDKLEAILTKTLTTIDRTKKGFEDFHPAAIQAIVAGRPAHSLLYHALASSQVHPTVDGMPLQNLAHYPSLEELDAIENYIYSLAADQVDLTDTVIAVFAYQYREASRTSHLRHADFVYSRTGVARVGTAEPQYNSSRRSFWTIPGNGGDAIAVLPARYGVFLARRAKAGAAGSVQGGSSLDENFVFPIHKLFAGHGCLKDKNIEVSFLEFHCNEKLRKLHQLPKKDGGLPVPVGFDINKPPYVRDSDNGNNLVSLKPTGSSVLVIPKPASTLVRTASQHNTVSGTDQIVYFIVPPAPRITTSTLEIPASNGNRLAPEYVNMRHQVDAAAPVSQLPKDLNNLAPEKFEATMAKGGYAAAHFIDDSCDGCIEATVKGLAIEFENLPAFSLVTAPDFFPLADQLEVEADPTVVRVRPLSKGRLPANLSLPRPSDRNAFAFEVGDSTITAVIGPNAVGPATTVIGHLNRAISFLPDAASDVFAPGWDTSRSSNERGNFLTSLGLGSPFPEDAKLCAAIGSFWPAVAPDNGRTFGNEQDVDIPLVNQLPMLDEELGFHPDHERVRVDEVNSYRGWDGEYGPFFEKVDGNLYVNYVAIERSDYVSQALAGRIRVSLTSEVQSEDLITRRQALNACNGVLRTVAENVCLVTVRKIDDWASAGRGRPELVGSGFLMEFAELTGKRVATAELGRVRKIVSKHHICQVGSNGIAYKNGSEDFIFKLI